MKKEFIYLIGIILLFGCNGISRKNPENPSSVPTEIKPSIKPIINVYIENSGSMDGYVTGVTKFEQSVYNYLSDIKIAKAADSLNLYYINSEILPQGTVSENMDVLKDFIEKLEPSNFKRQGGNRGTSDIADVIKSVLLKTGEKTISILVTDGIFSPGKGRDAEQYLINQQIGIKNSFSTFLGEQKNAAVIVYQLSSQFKGTYFNKIDARIPYDGQRPFYIWIIGNTDQLVNLRHTIPESKFGGSIQRIFSISSGNNNIKYAINPSIGKFKKSKTDTNTTIENLVRDSRTGEVKFAINVNFSDLLLDEQYLLDINNYEINNNFYTLEVKPNVKNGYTHTLYFTSSDNKPHKGIISLKLKVKRPDWIDEVNDDDGSNAINDKTYGIKYQVDGVFQAFTFYDDGKYYAEIKITIK